MNMNIKQEERLGAIVEHLNTKAAQLHTVQYAPFLDVARATTTLIDSVSLLLDAVHVLQDIAADQDKRNSELYDGLDAHAERVQKLEAQLCDDKAPAEAKPEQPKPTPHVRETPWGLHALNLEPQTLLLTWRSHTTR